MTIVLSEDTMPKTYRLDTHRPMPAGLDQQGRRAARGFGVHTDPTDTVPTDWDTDSREAFDSMPAPDDWFIAVLGVGCIAAVAVCALLVTALA